MFWTQTARPYPIDNVQDNRDDVRETESVLDNRDYMWKNWDVVRDDMRDVVQDNRDVLWDNRDTVGWVSVRHNRVGERESCRPQPH